MKKDSGDILAFLMIALCAAFALVAVYWVAALAFGAALVIFAIVAVVVCRLFRWPVERAAIPLARRLGIGRNAFTAILGLLLVLFCLGVSVAILSDFNIAAVRRFGQGLAVVKQGFGQWGDKFDSLAAEGLGTARYQRWTGWLWQEDMRLDDTSRWTNPAESPLPATLFHVSDTLNGWGSALENLVFKGERRHWFSYAYWFAVSVLAPSLAVSFLAMVYQLSSRAFMKKPSSWDRAFLSLTTLGLLCFLFAGFYLFPFVSHPFHNRDMPFWLPVTMYAAAAVICSGIVLANNRAIFIPGFSPANRANT